MPSVIPNPDPRGDARLATGQARLATGQARQSGKTQPDRSGQPDRFIRPKVGAKRKSRYSGTGHSTIKQLNLFTFSYSTKIFASRCGGIISFEGSILKRSGLEIAELTLNDWIKAVAEKLEPIYNVQRARILSQNYLMVDETTIPVLDSTKKGKTHIGFFWPYFSPVTIRDIPGRHAHFPKETLKDFTGYLQTDGYAGYNEVGRRSDVIQLACFAHARRKFEHALKNDKKRSSWMLKRIRYLYMVERKAQELGLTSEERYHFRQRHSIRQLEAMHQWVLKNRAEVVPKSAIGQAIDYTLSLWLRLRRYVEDGRLEIYNNLVENHARPIALGRKNYLFAGSHKGAKRAAIFYTILANAQLNGLEPKNYLRKLFTILPGYPENQLEDLLPENWKNNFEN